MSTPSFPNELVELVKKSIAERGLERSLQDTVANQYVIEQVQTEFHCVLNALISILLENNLINEEKLRVAIDERIKGQEEYLKKVLEEDLNRIDTEIEEAENNG